MSSNHSLHLLSQRSRHCPAGCSIDWLWRLTLARTATNGKCHPSPCSCPPTLVIRDPSTSIPHLAGIPGWIFLYFRPRNNILLYVLIIPLVRFIKCAKFLHKILAYSKSEHLMCKPVRPSACFTHVNVRVRIYLYTYINSWSRDSVVRIAASYGLDGPGIESRWGARFSALVQTGSEAHPASYTMGTGSFLGAKRPGRGVNHPPSRADAKERVQLYLYSPSGPSWPVLGWTSPLPSPSPLPLPLPTLTPHPPRFRMATVLNTRLNKYMEKIFPKGEKYKYTRKNVRDLLMAA